MMSYYPAIAMTLGGTILLPQGCSVGICISSRLRRDLLHRRFFFSQKNNACFCIFYTVCIFPKSCFNIYNLLCIFSHFAAVGVCACVHVEGKIARLFATHIQCAAHMDTECDGDPGSVGLSCLPDAKHVFPWENKVMHGVDGGKNYTYVLHDREYNFWPERPQGQQYVWYPITVHDHSSYSVVAHNDPNLRWTKKFTTPNLCSNWRSEAGVEVLTGRSGKVEEGPPQWLNATNFPCLGGAGAS